ncbi:hypothetical protein Tco_0871491 [Tanacetum coccineum]
MIPLGDHASHWSNYLGELIKKMPLYYHSWQKVLAEQKAAIMTKIGTQFDLKPHMQSQRWTDINAGIQQHLQKLNQVRAAQNRQNRSKSMVICRQGSRSLARLQDHMMESSSTREYPSLIHTFFITHTVGRVFMRDEDRALYRLGSNTETGVPYTEEEIMAIVRKGKQRGHLFGVGRVLPGRATNGCPPPPQSTVDPVNVEKLKKCNKSLTKQVEMMRLFRSDEEVSQMLDLFECWVLEDSTTY